MSLVAFVFSSTLTQLLSICPQLSNPPAIPLTRGWFSAHSDLTDSVRVAHALQFVWFFLFCFFPWIPRSHGMWITPRSWTRLTQTQCIISMSRLLTWWNSTTMQLCTEQQLYFYIDNMWERWLRNSYHYKAQNLHHQTTWEQDKVSLLPSNLCALTGDTMCCQSLSTGSVNRKGKVRLLAGPG